MQLVPQEVQEHSEVTQTAMQNAKIAPLPQPEVPKQIENVKVESLES